MANLVGTQVGAYIIDERLGSGGMGEVYKAHHERLKWQACVKVIRPDHADADSFTLFAALFEREAQVLAELDHPNIVRLRDFNTRREDGLAYLVMEFIPGGDLALRERRVNGPLPLGEVDQIVGHIAAGLQYAHDKGVLHRDLKPQNILCHPDGRLVIADFGLAKAVETALTHSRHQSTTSAGTPAYMAPEHIGGNPEYRSDLYALGILAYELLAGRVPFQGNAMQIMFAHTTQTPPALQALNPAVSPALEVVVLKMLAKDPAQRYQSATAFARALHEAIEQGTIPDRRGGEHWVLPPTEHEPTVPVEAPPTLDLSPAAEAPLASGVTPRLDARPTVPAERLPGLEQPALPGGLIGRAYPAATAPVSPTASTAPSGKAYWQRPWLWGITVLAVGVVLVLVTRFPSSPTATAPTAVPSVASTAVPTFIILSGHTNYVRSVAFSPDGRTLASGSEDKTIKLWDVASGKVLRTLSGHSDAVYSVAFSPAGTSRAPENGSAPPNYTLASGSGDGTIKLWDVGSGQALRTLSGHSKFIATVVFSPDGRTLASGSADQTIKLWDVASGRELLTLSGHTNYVYSVAFSPDGRTLASGSADQTIKLWDVASGKVLRTLSGHTNYVNSVAFSPAGTSRARENGSAPPNYILASGSEDQTIKLWDVASGKVLRTLSGHTNYVNSVAFSPAGTSRAPENGSAPPNYTLASGSGDGTIKLWDVASGKVLRTLSGHSNFINSVAFSPAGTSRAPENGSAPPNYTLASGSGDGTIRLWKV